jgi:hypothetical protein
MPASPSKKIVETPLAKAASALEGELLEYEKFVSEVKRMNLNTEKAMHRAKDLLEHCAAGEQRMAEPLVLHENERLGALDPRRDARERTRVHDRCVVGGPAQAVPYSDSAILNVRVSSSW